MLRFMLIRSVQALPVIFVVITATFFLVRSAPGGPFDQEKVVIPEVRKALEAQYRLDLPLHEQYFAYLGDLAQGDLGPSFKYPGRSVNEILFAGLPVTAELGLYALIIALCIGVTAGVLASLRPNTAQDYIPMSLAMIGIFGFVCANTIPGSVPLLDGVIPAYSGAIMQPFNPVGTMESVWTVGKMW